MEKKLITKVVCCNHFLNHKIIELVSKIVIVRGIGAWFGRQVGVIMTEQ